MGTFSVFVPKGRLLINTGGWIALSETGVVGGGVAGGDFSLSCPSSIRIGFSLSGPISEPLIVKGKNGVPMPGLKTASMFKSGSSQSNSISSRVDTWYPLVSMCCALALESISTRSSNIPSWFGVSGTRAGWLLENSHLWDNNKLQTARGKSRKIIVNSWMRSFTVRVTESGLKSRDFSIPPLETDKIMLL